MLKRVYRYTIPLSIFLSAFAVRLLYNLTVGQGYHAQYDAGYYEHIALHILYHRCYCLYATVPNLNRAPLWPFLIAVIYFFTGQDTLYPRLFLSLIGSGTCVLVYLFARDIFNERAAVAAGVIAAISPGLFIYDGWMYTESLYTFLIMLFLYSLYRLQRTARQHWLFVAAGALALASLTRPNGPFMLVLLLAWAVLAVRAGMMRARPAFEAVLVIIVVTFLLILPWTLRNYTASQRFILIATGDETVLTGAYNDSPLYANHEQGMWSPPDQIRPVQARNLSYTPTWIRNHLSSMPYLLGLHFYNMWRPSTPEANLPSNQFPERLSSQIVTIAMNLAPIPIFLLAAFGLVVTRRQWRELLIPYLAITLTILQCIAFYGSSRFRSPIEPLLVLLAAGAIWWLDERLKRRAGPEYSKQAESGGSE